MRRMWAKGQLDKEVKYIIKSGTVDNAKPIFWHSCQLKRVSESNLIFFIDFIVLNNDNTPFTLETFMDWLKSLPSGARIKAVQGYDASAPSDLVSYFRLWQINSIKIASINLTTGEESLGTEWTVSSDIGTELTDVGVNKIN